MNGVLLMQCYLISLILNKHIPLVLRGVEVYIVVVLQIVDPHLWLGAPSVTLNMYLLIRPV